MKRQIKLVDTTLRDGEQCPGIVFAPSDKIRLALLLDEIGVYEIEAGIFDTRTEGQDYIKEIVSKRTHAVISVWSRLKPQDVEEAARQKPDLIHIGAPVSFPLIYHKIKKNKRWVENMLSECIETAGSYGIPVTVGFEDASRANMGFMVSLIRKAQKLGVKTIRLADTVGILMPDRARQMIRELKQSTDIQIEVHEHNDFGMAVANSLVMASEGADMVDVTVCGIGERAGNCNMTDFIHGAGRKLELGVNVRDARRAEKLLKEITAGGRDIAEKNHL